MNKCLRSIDSRLFSAKRDALPRLALPCHGENQDEINGREEQCEKDGKLILHGVFNKIEFS